MAKMGAIRHQVKRPSSGQIFYNLENRDYYATPDAARHGIVLGSWCLVPGAWCLVPGAWCLVPGAWCLVPGAWCLVTNKLGYIVLGYE